MKCENLFSGHNKENFSNCRLLKFLPSMPSVKYRKYRIYTLYIETDRSAQTIKTSSEVCSRSTLYISSSSFRPINR